MQCRRCPHHVRHGQIGDRQSIVFRDICGLRHKKTQETDIVSKKTKYKPRSGAISTQKSSSSDTPPQPSSDVDSNIECTQVPFSQSFDYFSCPVYQEYFASQGLKNGVFPTKDFQYSEQLNSVSLTDMELL